MKITTRLRFIFCIVFAILIFYFANGMNMNNFIDKSCVSSTCSNGKIFNVGRYSFSLPEIETSVYISGETASYNGVSLIVNKNISKETFLKETDLKWKKIKKNDEGNKNKPFMEQINSTSFRFSYDFTEINYKGLEPTSGYSSQGTFWHNENVLLLAPEGRFKAGKDISLILANIQVDSTPCIGFHFDEYCLKLPPSIQERSTMNLMFKSIDGLSLHIEINSYPYKQQKYLSELYNLFSEKIKIDGVNGEYKLTGNTTKLPDGRYYNYITTIWYYPGISEDPLNPEIKLTLTYEYKTDHKPSSSSDWFDDETIKQTGFTAEQFMSIWKATLSSFHRNC